MKKHPCPRNDCRRVWVYEFEENIYISQDGEKCKVVPSVYREQKMIPNPDKDVMVNIFKCLCGSILSFQVIHPEVFGHYGDGSANYYF